MGAKKQGNADSGLGAPADTRSAKVTLCGETLPLRTDQSPEALSRLEAFVNQRARAAGAGEGASPENFRRLALAALGIAGELFEAQARLEEKEEDSRSLKAITAKARSLNDSLERALARKA